MSEEIKEMLNETVRQARSLAVEKDPVATAVKLAIGHSTAMKLYFTIVEALAVSVIEDPSTELDDGVQELENAIYLLRKAYDL